MPACDVVLNHYEQCLECVVRDWNENVIVQVSLNTCIKFSSPKIKLLNNKKF